MPSIRSSQLKSGVLILATLLAASAPASAEERETRARDNPVGACDKLPAYDQLRATLREVVAMSKTGELGGLQTDKWAALVDRDGVVCAVAYSGAQRGDQWPASRAIALNKASTGNAFSLPAFAISSGNLYQAVQPGRALFGVPLAVPADAATLYSGRPELFGQPNDPVVGKKIGGMSTVGGGLGLYNAGGEIVGGLGVSGDSPCVDHIVAWIMRDKLRLDYVPRGLMFPTDNLIHDTTADPVTGHVVSASGFGHPACFDETAFNVVNALPSMYPTGGANAK